MAPGTTIGAAHPVEEGGGDIKGVMGQKIENFTASFARSIAQQRGRNQDWIEQAVRHSLAIGEREALAKNVVDIVAPDLPSLLTQASGRKVEVAGQSRTLKLADATVRRVRMTLAEQILNTLSDPNIVYLLLMGGLIGLYFEFAHPGVIFPGVAGAICLLLALAAFQVLPINLAGLLLIFLGVGLLITEAFVTSYGILGVGGVVSLVIGSLFLIDTSKTDLAVSHGIIYGAATALTLIILGIGFIVTRERNRPVKTGPEGLLGEVGEVREPIAPGVPGKVFVHGEIWRAISSEPLGAGAHARVKAIKGLELEVQRIV
jgi:membrane-bound serine protease (ClpP class)